MLSYDIIFLSYKRPAAIYKAVKYALAQDPKPNKVVVWHNSPSAVKIPDVINIYSEENYGCQVRHVVGLLSLSDIVVFVDDEIFLKSPFCCSLMTQTLETHPLSVVGYEGRLLANNQQPYSTGTDVRKGKCSVMKGALHAVQKHILPCPFLYNVDALKHDGIMVEDDIVLSASVTMKTGCSPIAVDFPQDWIARDPSMRDENSVCRRKNHKQRRDEACLHMMRLGWKPELQ